MDGALKEKNLSPCNDPRARLRRVSALGGRFLGPPDGTTAEAFGHNRASARYPTPGLGLPACCAGPITTDGFAPHHSAIHNTLFDRVHLAQVIKVHRANQRDLPVGVVAVEVVSVLGNPDPARNCTSYVERHNLTMRMQIRRLTRPTNPSSKKWGNLWAALCLHFAYYNFCGFDRTIRVSGSIEAGLAVKT